MSLIEIILIAIGLAMDCFAVATASSMALGRYDWAKMLRMALMFSLFQTAMPLIGYLAGVHFSATFIKIDHWVAFIILGLLGGKMIWSSLKKNKQDELKHSPFTSWGSLLLLSVATSIDALATGLIFVPYHHLIYKVLIVIAIVSFGMTILGCFIGVQFGKRFKLNVELIGGLILIGIGVNILFEHIAKAW